MVPMLANPLARWASGVLAVMIFGGFTGSCVRGKWDAARLERMEAKNAALLRDNKELVERAKICDASYKQCKANTVLLEEAIEMQNEAITVLASERTKAEERQRAAERRLREYLARPTPTPPVLAGTCEEMVEQVRQAAMEWR